MAKTMKLVGKKPASKAAAPVAVAAAPAAKKAKASEGKYIGATSGLRVGVFQNKTLEDNRKKKLTDEELVALWNAEYPNARTGYNLEIVRGVRNMYNLGKHNNEVPVVAIPEYDAEGKPVAARVSVGRGKKKDDDEEEEVEVAPAVKQKAGVKKSVKKIVK